MRTDFFSTQEGLACNREIRKRLGQTLRATYEPTLAQDLPEHLVNLLRRLDKRERREPSLPRRADRGV